MSDVGPKRLPEETVGAETTRVAVPWAEPPTSSLFQPTGDQYGLRLALVFGNHAPGGFCPYYVGTRCHHCDIGAGEGAAFDLATNLRRLDWFRQHYAAVWPEVSHLVLYNSGSVLNRQEMPRELIDQILQFARSLPKLRVVSMDSREHFIQSDLLIQACRILGNTIAVRPVLGLETANDFIRNQLLEKQMSRANILRAYEAINSASTQLETHRLGLDVNVVVAGPGTTFETAMTDAVETARFAFQTGRDYGVSVDLNIHPYYPSVRGLARFPDHGRCPLSVLARSMAAICEVRRTMAPTSSIFIGWHDEAHDQEPHRRAHESELVQQAIDQFNRTQDDGCFETCVVWASARTNRVNFPS